MMAATRWSARFTLGVNCHLVVLFFLLIFSLIFSLYISDESNSGAFRPYLISGIFATKKIYATNFDGFSLKLSKLILLENNREISLSVFSSYRTVQPGSLSSLNYIYPSFLLV